MDKQYVTKTADDVLTLMADFNITRADMIDFMDENQPNQNMSQGDLKEILERIEKLRSSYLHNKMTNLNDGKR